MTTFKAKTFRLNASTQYADQLWLNSLGAIATSSTGGEAESVKVAYLADDDNAVPSVFGSMSWRTATEEVPSYCQIKLYDGVDMVPAMTVEPTLATFNGDLLAAGRGTLSGLTVDGPVYFPSMPASSSSMFMTWDPSTGEVSYSESSAIGEYIETGELPVLTITESLRLPNAQTFRTPYLLHLEPITGTVFVSEAPYAVTTVDDVIDSVTFASNVIAGNVSAGTVEAANVFQVGSGSDVWRLRPDAESGSLAVEKLEGGAWVTKSLIGSV